YKDTYRNAPRDGSARTPGSCDGRVLRGGSWFVRPEDLRSAVRYGDRPGYRSFDDGFRLARTLTP
ncbi:MAG: SUMF1/EgtB/PvdO family nonheme iron enzyme, partial [Proteobacteria bacterium]|nr:SUMF1/EgtB/PvdO family nonheme iron enzyme [Pseudomonadota bacterium]